MKDIFAKACAIQEKVQSWRHYMHQNPELGMQTEGTASFIEKILAEIGIENVRRCGGTGVVALIEGATPGPCIGLRADMDALPVQERNALSYCSSVEGRAHVCGHDVHAACLLGAAQLLFHMKDALHGSVKLIFQPGEELLLGAKAMIADGALENPVMKSIYALHAWPEIPAGTIGLRKGSILASAQLFKITVRGLQGHGAHPHRCVDTVLIAAQIICALQSIVSREISPLEMGLLTIGKVQGGSAGNIIPEVVYLEGTVRTFSKEGNERIVAAATRIAEGVAASMRGSATFEAQPGMPPVINEDKAYATMCAAFERTFSKEQLVELPLPSMGGEDYSLFTNSVPGGHFRLGVGSVNGPNPPLHSPEFMVDESCLPCGVAAMTALVLQELGL